MKSIILFDTIADGHHTDYFLHLINYWSRFYDSPDTQLVVVASQELVDNYQKNYNTTPIAWSARIVFEAIDPALVTSLRGMGMAKRSFAEWNLVRSYEAKYQPHGIVLMYLDIFQLGMLLGKRLKTRFSGIFFRPTPTNLAPTFRNFLLRWRKDFLLKLSLKFGGIDTLFCLDESAVARLQAMSHTPVKWLPDPIEQYDIAEEELLALRKSLNISADRKILLLFGFLDERKCVEQSIEALRLLDTEAQQQVTLLLVGTIDDTYKHALLNKIETCKNVQIVTQFGGVYGRDIQKYFGIADGILAVYQNHIGSSSVIIRAAVSQKPLIVKDFGYMGEFVKKHQIGLLTDSTLPEEIAQKVRQFLNNDFEISKEIMKQIAQKNSAQNYAKILFDSILR
jgi:glycosyltransferase involved in cell wall biosynthesis